MLDQKSEANLETAKLCFEKKNENFYSVGVSRAYYAIFQMTKYLLEKNGFDYKLFKKNDAVAKKQRDYAHGSISSALEHFLLTNGFNSKDDLKFIDDMHSTFLKLYSWRLQGDYEKIIIYKVNLKKAIERAEILISELKKIQLRINL